MRIDIINGPNLNLLGERETKIYGTTRLDEIQKQCEARGQQLGYEIFFSQSNSESKLIEEVQRAHREAQGIILNAAGYSHSSISLLDTLLAGSTPVIEVHLSNIFARESFRQKSLLASAARGVICGFGAHGYVLALEALAEILKAK